MKKLILAFFLFMSVIGTASAPPSNTMFIPIPTPIIYFDGGSYAPLIDAMFTYEASRDTLAHNDLEDAHGGLQIRQGRLTDYNICNGTNYTLEDCYNYEISKKIFLYFTNHTLSGKHIPYKTWEWAARDWNGSGRATEIYWENVKNLI
jgi:hypothetical protein